MEEIEDGSVSVSSRIKQLAAVLPVMNPPTTYSAYKGPEPTSKILHAKLKPTVRRRHHTEQISAESFIALRRSSSNPDLEQFAQAVNAKPPPSPKPTFKPRHNDISDDSRFIFSSSKQESLDNSVAIQPQLGSPSIKPVPSANKPPVTAKPKLLHVPQNDSTAQISSQISSVGSSNRPRVPTKKIVIRDKRASSDACPPSSMSMDDLQVSGPLSRLSRSFETVANPMPLCKPSPKEKALSVSEIGDVGSAKSVSMLNFECNNNQTEWKLKSGPPKKPVPRGPGLTSSSAALVTDSSPISISPKNEVSLKSRTSPSTAFSLINSSSDDAATAGLEAAGPPKPPRGKSKSKTGSYENSDVNIDGLIGSAHLLVPPPKLGTSGKLAVVPRTPPRSVSSCPDMAKTSAMPTNTVGSPDTSSTSKHTRHPHHNNANGGKVAEKIVASLRKSCPPASSNFLKQGKPPLHVATPSVVPPVPLHLRVRSKSVADVTEEEDYDYAYDHMQASVHKPGVAGNPSASEQLAYDLPDQNAVQGFMASLRKRELGSDDSDYEDPPDIDYEEPFNEPLLESQGNIGPHTEISKGTASSSDEDYCDPDVTPPTSPKAFIIPGHSQNNLDSSSDDNDDAYDYTDPEEYLSKLPLHMKLSKRRSSQQHCLDPSVYVPIKEITGSGLSHEIDVHPEYIDPEKAMPTCLSGVSDLEKGVDIYSDEPLYQVYQADMLEEVRRLSKKQEHDSKAYAGEESDVYNEYVSTSQKSLRLLWCELPLVRASGLLDSISESERKRQEAMFEVISSEASYLKSLDILVSHFVMCKEFSPKQISFDAESGLSSEPILDKQQYHLLFSGLTAIKSVSERFLKDLRKRQQQTNALIHSISDIIIEYAEKRFDCYVKYISNQVFQDRAYTALLHASPRFVEVLMNLERHPRAQGLSMQSFLTLPMQRITRLPLLVDAICHRCEQNTEERRVTDLALKAVQKLVRDSNEGARQMIRTEEMYFIQRMLTFKIKPVPLISASRWLVKRGDLTCLHEAGRFSKYKSQLRQLLRGRYKKIHLFLFTDLLLVTKAKGEDNFKVIDYCFRSLVRLEELQSIPNPEPPKTGTLNITPTKYAFTVILLENSNGKTVDYHCFLEAESDITRWREAFFPAKQASEYEGEYVYDDWDCPQVQAIHAYQAQQPDEITLHEGDVIKVLRKLRDGWAEGLRLRDDERGWFPIGFCEEVDSKHMRARNLMQRYRLLHASKSIVDTILGNTLKK